MADQSIHVHCVTDRHLIMHIYICIMDLGQGSDSLALGARSPPRRPE